MQVKEFLYEIIQMAQLDGYKTGGTIHMSLTIKLVLPPIGWRSSTYCTDVAKVTLSPVLCNADDEAVVHAMSFALDYECNLVVIFYRFIRI
jgi:2-oxoglutarate dehydrogenase E1 component